MVMHMHLGCKLHPFMSCLVYYILWNYSESTKQKWENDHAKCSRKQKFLLFLWKSRNGLRKSYTSTVIMSVKTWWACLDLSLSVIVFDECMPLGSARIQTGMFRIKSTGVTSCCANYREWHFSALLVLSSWAMVNADFCFGTCQKCDHKFFSCFYSVFPLSPEIVCLKLVCLCSEAYEMYLQLLIFPLLE